MQICSRAESCHRPERECRHRKPHRHEPFGCGGLCGGVQSPCIGYKEEDNPNNHAAIVQETHQEFRARMLVPLMFSPTGMFGAVSAPKKKEKTMKQYYIGIVVLEKEGVEQKIIKRFDTPIMSDDSAKARQKMLVDAGPAIRKLGIDTDDVKVKVILYN